MSPRQIRSHVATLCAKCRRRSQIEADARILCLYPGQVIVRAMRRASGCIVTAHSSAHCKQIFLTVRGSGLYPTIGCPLWSFPNVKLTSLRWYPSVTGADRTPFSIFPSDTKPLMGLAARSFTLLHHADAVPCFPLQLLGQGNRTDFRWVCRSS
jgi:hypothetical protein